MELEDCIVLTFQVEHSCLFAFLISIHFPDLKTDDYQNFNIQYLIRQADQGKIGLEY